LIILELVLIFIVALIFIKIIIGNALKLGLVDIPNSRSMHIRHHPRGAGIGFFLAVALVTPFFHYSLLQTHLFLIAAVLAVFIVGVLDDHQDTSPRTKFIVLILASVLVYFDGVSVTTLGNFFGMEIKLGWLALPFTIFAIVGFTNALNLIDGLDGLAGAMSIVILSTLYVVAYEHNDDFMMMISSTFIVALLAFLVYNWNPASIFMGDSGSLILGFIIGVLVIKAAAYIHPVSVLFIIAVPLMDTIIVMVRRKLTGHSMFEADKTHLHHILYGFFNKDIKMSTIFLTILQAVYSLTGLMLIDHSNETLSLMLFVLNTVLLYFISSGMLRRQAIIDAK